MTILSHYYRMNYILFLYYLYYIYLNNLLLIYDEIFEDKISHLSSKQGSLRNS